jgi:hypothetical protein
MVESSALTVPNHHCLDAYVAPLDRYYCPELASHPG